MTHVYRTQAELAGYNAGTTAWDRVVQALASITPDDPTHTRSLGDCLTYWVVDAADLTRSTYTASLLYQTLLHPLTADLRLSVAPRSALTVVEPYRDVDDTESLAGQGEELVVPAGAVALIGLHEGWRVTSGDGRVAVLRLTTQAPAARPGADPRGPAAASDLPAGDLATIAASAAAVLPVGAP